MKFFFEDFEVDLSSKTVFSPDGEVPLRQKAFELLVYFLENRTRIISKEELLKKVWPDQHVIPQVVIQTISELRKTFSHSNSGRSVIKTYPRKGYMWDVEVSTFSNGVREDKIHQDIQQTKSIRGLVSILVIFGVVLLSFAIWHFNSEKKPVPGKLKLVMLPFVNDTGSADEEYLELGLRDMVVKSFDQQFTFFPIEEILNILKLKPDFNRPNPTKEDLDYLKEAMAFDAVIATNIQRRDGKYHFTFSFYGPEKLLGKVESNIAEPLKLWRPIGAGLSNYLHTSLEIKLDDPDYSFKSNQLFWKGRQYQLQGENKKALPYFRVCLDESPEFAKASLQLANSLLQLGSYEDANKEIQRALAILKTRPNPLDLAEADYLLGKYFLNVFDLENATTHTENALSQFQTMDQPVESAMCYNLLGSIYYDRLDFKQSESSYRLAVSLLKKLGDYYALPFVYLNWGNVLSTLGQWDRAHKLWEEANDLFNAYGVRRGKAKALFYLGDYFRWKKQFEKAEDYFVEARSIFVALGEKQRIANVDSELGTLAFEKGDLATCLEVRKQVLNEYEQLGNELNVSIVLNNLATVYLALRNFDQAETYLNLCLEKTKSIEDSEGQLYAYFGFIELAFHRGNVKRMQFYLEKARDVAQGNTYLKASLLCYEALVAFQEGDVEGAIQKQESSKSLSSDWNDYQESYLKAYHQQAENLKEGGPEVVLPLSKDSRIGPLGM